MPVWDRSKNVFVCTAKPPRPALPRPAPRRGAPFVSRWRRPPRASCLCAALLGRSGPRALSPHSCDVGERSAGTRTRAEGPRTERGSTAAAHPGNGGEGARGGGLEEVEGSPLTAQWGHPDDE